MFKVNEISEVIKLVDHSSSVQEFTLEQNDIKITIKKATAEKSLTETPVKSPVPEASTSPDLKENNQAENQKVEDNTNKVSENLVEITSPMIGTFYSSPNPESAPFVEVGKKVQQEDVVCILEAMKLFNEIESEVKGEIVEVLVEDGQLVDYGQPMFKVKVD
ncbi:acetyl-CoA carboxylase biotin carboxyl carrier protein [Alkalihalobacillus sp. MEB130]|uniref:acetyl-CoA carboxylase biotin carboxyl carrier protein n=1 Tax=Alkalihalobacillus sp. MEB130 TaxID=2976704 RepID=UPI0028DE3523|nr:acetyl-CoA carboxylase biotin carboxyl carrier protein [Alkalihalobacillus sp. MEB130]MDT8862425.1 acetyl-CoA carboxylase biotin carboxyl carrier protein [Alkalihalobacillus sp. MEB130]